MICRHARLLGVLVCLSSLVLGAAPVRAQERPLVAVLDLKGPPTITRSEMDLLTDEVREVALESIGGTHDVITRENLIDLLKSHGKTMEQCQSECITEYGRDLGAEIVVSGSITKAFGAYQVNLKMHNTKPPRLLGRKAGSSARKTGLVAAVKSTAEELFDGARLGGLDDERGDRNAPSQGGETEADREVRVMVRFGADDPAAAGGGAKEGKGDSLGPILIGAGATAVVGALIMHVSAFDAAADANAAYDEVARLNANGELIPANAAHDEARALDDEAKHSRVIAFVGYGVAAVLMGVGTWMVMDGGETSPSSGEISTDLGWTPLVQPSRGGLFAGAELRF